MHQEGVRDLQNLQIWSLVTSVTIKQSSSNIHCILLIIKSFDGPTLVSMIQQLWLTSLKNLIRMRFHKPGTKQKPKIFKCFLHHRIEHLKIKSSINFYQKHTSQTFKTMFECFSRPRFFPSLLILKRYQK